VAALSNIDLKVPYEMNWNAFNCFGHRLASAWRGQCCKFLCTFLAGPKMFLGDDMIGGKIVLLDSAVADCLSGAVSPTVAAFLQFYGAIDSWCCWLWRCSAVPWSGLMREREIRMRSFTYPNTFRLLRCASNCSRLRS